MIIDIGKETIDLSKVERVGAVAGDPSWLSYNVYFTGGGKIEIYEERMGGLQMKRETFVKLWREVMPLPSVKEINNKAMEFSNKRYYEEKNHFDTTVNDFKAGVQWLLDYIAINER